MPMCTDVNESWGYRGWNGFPLFGDVTSLFPLSKQCFPKQWELAANLTITIPQPPKHWIHKWFTCIHFIILDGFSINEILYELWTQIMSAPNTIRLISVKYTSFILETIHEPKLSSQRPMCTSSASSQNKKAKEKAHICLYNHMA